MNRILCAWVTLLACDVVLADPPPTPPAMVRVVVLDRSGSMAIDGRLDQARRELIDLARQLPPSATHPMIVIPFDTQPQNVQTFTELAALETYLANVRAGGGTNVASGLERALAELKPYEKARHICVLLYTDGEDSDQAGIDRQEEQLDRLFANRQKQQLHQSVVFAKRWEKANAALLGKIAQRGHARVIDGGELKMKPVSLEPKIEVVKASWSKDKPATLVIDLQGRIDVKGDAGKSTFPGMKATCRTAGAQGDVAVSITPKDGKAVPMTIQLPVTMEQQAAGKIELEFDIAQPAPMPEANGIILPWLTVDLVRVPVNVPMQFHCTWEVEVTALPARWSDPLAKRMVAPIMVRVTVSATPELDWPYPARLQLHIPSGHRILGPEILDVPGPGLHEFPIEMEVEPGTLLSKAGDVHSLTIDLQTENSPVFIFDPPKRTCQVDTTVPALLRTQLTGRVIATSQPRWVDLVRGVAAVEADVEFKVDGPIAANTAITVQCPSSVRLISFAPAVIATGTQTVRVSLEAEMVPAPGKQNLVLVLLPPSPQGAVEIVAGAPLRLSVPGPAPVQLMLRVGGRLQRRIDVSTNDQRRPVRVIVSAELAGAQPHLRGDGLQARATGGPELELAAPAMPLASPVEMELSVPKHRPLSFFFDTVVREEIVVQPEPASPAIVGSKHELVLIVEAPFKRLLFYLVASGSTVIGVFVFLRMVMRLKTKHVDRRRRVSR